MNTFFLRVRRREVLDATSPANNKTQVLLQQGVNHLVFGHMSDSAGANQPYLHALATC